MILHSSPDIIRAIESRRMCLAGQVAGMGDSRGVYRGDLRERDHLEDIGVDENVISQWMLHSSPDIIRAIETRRMCLPGQVAGMGDSRGVYRGDLRERDHLEDLGVDENVISQWMFKKCDGEAWTGLIWLRIGTGGGLL